jgi:hypothetical protein
MNTTIRGRAGRPGDEKAGQIAHPGGRAVHVHVNQDVHRQGRHNWAGTWGIPAARYPKFPTTCVDLQPRARDRAATPRSRGAPALLHSPEMGHSTLQPNAEALFE